MQVFAAVAEAQSFNGASRKLGFSPPAVTRAIANLENQLGVKLLHRTTRHVRPTDAGVRYLEDVRNILEHVEQANEAARGVNATPKGELTVTAPVLFGQKFVTPVIARYLLDYAQTKVQGVFLDRVVNMVEEGMDVGVRIGHLPDSSLQAIPVGKVRQVLVASNQYLSQQGIPQQPNDLIQHGLISPSAASFAKDWQFREGKDKQWVRIQPRFSTTSNQAAINAAKANLGITRVLYYQVVEELISGELKTLLEAFELDPLPIHVVHREGRQASSKVRSFIDMLVDSIRTNQSLNP